MTAGLNGHHEVVTVDLPGHGHSGPATDLPTAADQVVHAGGSGCYVGYSLGGRTALYAALAHPEQVDRLVLVSATAGIDTESGRVERRTADHALAASIEADGVDSFLRRWLTLPLFEHLSPDPVDLTDRRRNRTDGLATSLRLAGTGTMDPPLWSRLHELEMPVLVLAGERDDKFSALARRLADGIGPNARSVLVSDAGHAAHLEQPDQFLSILEDFLSARNGEPGGQQ